MVNPRFFIAAVVAAAHVPFVASFQPGADYGVRNTPNLYNCTGGVPMSNLTVSNAFDTLPQIEPSTECGWEQWSLFLHGTFQMILRWNRGNPSSDAPSPAYFDVFMNINGTVVQDTVAGEFSYTNNERVKQISIGNSSLTWDSDALWYNVSVNIDGYQLELDSFSAMLDSFHPNVALTDGLLDQSGGWFASVPLIRGHVVGNLYTPQRQNITLDGLTVIRHMFSENLLPPYVNKYSGGTFWGHSTAFYDSHIFYRTETTNGAVSEAAFLGRAIPIPGQDGLFSSAWATYAVSDDSKLYRLSIDAATNSINASFSGCSDMNYIPYLFNTSSLTPVARFTDLGGGTTAYYVINGTTTAPFKGVVTIGALAGFFEEYLAP